MLCDILTESIRRRILVPASVCISTLASEGVDVPILTPDRFRPETHPIIVRPTAAIKIPAANNRALEYIHGHGNILMLRPLRWRSRPSYAVRFNPIQKSSNFHEEKFKSA